MLSVTYNKSYSKYNSCLLPKGLNGEIYVTLMVISMTLAFIKGLVTQRDAHIKEQYMIKVT